MALFGKDVAELFATFRATRKRVAIAAQALIRSAPQYAKDLHYEDEKIRVNRENWERLIGWGEDDNDKVAEQINAAVATVEQVCAPAIDGYYKQRARPWWKWPGQA